MRVFGIKRFFLFLEVAIIFSFLLFSPLCSAEGLSLVQEAKKQEKSQDESKCTAEEHKVEVLFDIIRSRRTVREFKDTPVPEEHILKILDMARYAPTAGNQQTWKFVVVRQPENLKALKKSLKEWWKEMVDKSKFNQTEKRNRLKMGYAQIDRIMTAPVYIFIFAGTTVYGHYALHDGCLAAGNLMLAARAMGYGTGFFTTFFPPEKVKEFLNVAEPENLQFICAIPLGVPKQWPKMPPKKELKEFIVYEKFEKKTN